MSICLSIYLSICMYVCMYVCVSEISIIRIKSRTVCVEKFSLVKHDNFQTSPIVYIQQIFYSL